MGSAAAGFFSSQATNRSGSARAGMRNFSFIGMDGVSEPACGRFYTINPI
jgi:hypothetical protein